MASALNLAQVTCGDNTSRVFPSAGECGWTWDDHRLEIVVNFPLTNALGQGRVDNMRTPMEQTKFESEKCLETLGMIEQPHWTNTERLGLVGSLAITVRHLEAAIVAECRACGWTWAEIGEALNCSKQAAQQRFG